MLEKDDEILLYEEDYSLELEKYYNPNVYHTLDNRNGTIKKAYAFSNERIDAVFNHFNFLNKNILTVGSSGDQAFASIIRGAKQITVIDSNIFTKPYIEYKIAAIKTFNLAEFRLYFIDNPNPFDWKIYSKISHHLDKKDKLFWDHIILNQNNSLETYINMIHQEKWKVKIISKMFKEKNLYNQLKEKLFNIKIKYIYSEFNDFAIKCEYSYDIIILSNIYKYVNKEKTNTFVNVINELYFNHLNDGGKIQIHYEYNNKRGIPMDIFKKLFINIKSNYIFIGNHFSYYLSKPKSNNITQKNIKGKQTCF